MIPFADRRDQSPGWMFILSLALHILILFICSNTNLFRATLHEATPYYVDIVSLPALEATSTEPQGQQIASPPPLSPAVPPPKTPVAPAMTAPVKSAPKQIPPATSTPNSDDQEAREFAERMSRLEHRSEAKHQAAALDSLQKKATEQKRPSGGGAPTKGAGADYGSYIQSRLKDALSNTIVYRSQKPEAAVHLYIDKKGKLIKYVMLRPSADKLFNDSVIRTIEKAKANFSPNPAGSDFDKLFVFSPQEVSK